MPRNETDITIDASGGRDAGKTFHLTEMGAEPFFYLVVEVLGAIKRADPELDIDINGGPEALFGPVMQSLLKCDLPSIRSISDKLLACVTMRPNSKEANYTRPLLPDDIEEAVTHLHLRREVFRLHVGF